MSYETDRASFLAALTEQEIAEHYEDLALESAAEQEAIRALADEVEP